MTRPRSAVVRAAGGTRIVPLKSEETIGGYVYYTDTDSILTDVEIPSSTELGMMKDEYPGEWLRFRAVQPKVYMIERATLNDDLTARAALMKASRDKPDDYDASTIDSSCGPPGLRETPLSFEQKKAKVTMKGFPVAMRTKENLERLETGEVLTHLPSGERWKRLEKIRTLARSGFREPPKMNEVEKSFRSKYDKRLSTDDHGTLLPDGATRAIVLHETVGVYENEDDDVVMVDRAAE